MIEHFKIEYDGCIAEVSEFATAEGPKEYHLMLHPTASGSFEDQYNSVKYALAAFIAGNPYSVIPVFMRWFLSDAANQQQIVEADDYGCAVSIIGQPPLDGNKLSLWVYLAEGASVKKADDGVWEVDFLGMRHIWTANELRHEGNPEKQTWDIFDDYSDRLARRKCTLKENCIRTWIFVQNIDVNYSGVVKGRREYFTKDGLTPDTHYIASTGIAGRIADSRSSMVMDTYAVDGISSEQVHFLKGATHLNPTHEYGVTFERPILLTVSTSASQRAAERTTTFTKQAQRADMYAAKSLVQTKTTLLFTHRT